ncbi:hypothetical protein C0581_01140 [Candidatus Parcubacteria bacterium]|nr:MAG: hypothetical protein C0581_01140 [Candidatus Parcubacteria bacterium]
MDLSKLYKKQISMHEWFENIGHKDAQAVREEDYTRQERLKQLNAITDLPYDRPEIFTPHDILDTTEKFDRFLNENRDKKCRLRLVPLVPDKQKLRSVGRTVGESVDWFKEQNVEPNAYELHFLSFTENPQWATIFVINENGIFGEAVFGGHNQLTQGFHEQRPITFSFDFNSWELSEENEQARKHLEKIISYLHILDISAQQKVKESLHTDCTHNYIKGYFETVSDRDLPLQFIDYNRVLGKLYSDVYITPSQHNTGNLTGQTGSPGKATGSVRIITPGQIPNTTLQPHEILVCDVTSPDYVPLMKQAAAIITDRGGILSHAAIVSREMNKPCIVGTENATGVLKDGQEVKMDAETGTIEVL